MTTASVTLNPDGSMRHGTGRGSSGLDVSSHSVSWEGGGSGPGYLTEGGEGGDADADIDVTGASETQGQELATGLTYQDGVFMPLRLQGQE